MQLVLFNQTVEHLHKLVKQSAQNLSSLAKLNNKATNAKLESAKNLATQTKQCD
jgi:hypothetical protein